MANPLDPKDARVVSAQDSAARIAEHLPDDPDKDPDRLLALDILNNYTAGLLDFADDPDGLVRSFHGGKTEGKHVIWAVKFAENLDLRHHEAQLLDLAWEKLCEDTDQQQWEQLVLSRPRTPQANVGDSANSPDASSEGDALAG